jgi:hypothetical protein
MGARAEAANREALERLTVCSVHAKRAMEAGPYMRHVYSWLEWLRFLVWKIRDNDSYVIRRQKQPSMRQQWLRSPYGGNVKK